MNSISHKQGFVKETVHWVLPKDQQTRGLIWAVCRCKAKGIIHTSYHLKITSSHHKWWNDLEPYWVTRRILKNYNIACFEGKREGKTQHQRHWTCQTKMPKECKPGVFTLHTGLARSFCSVCPPLFRQTQDVKITLLPQNYTRGYVRNFGGQDRSSFSTLKPLFVHNSPLTMVSKRLALLSGNYAWRHGLVDESLFSQ